MTRTVVAGVSGWAAALGIGLVFGGVSSRPQAAPAPVAQAPAAASPSVPARALVDKYCLTCHSARAKSGGLVLEGVDLTSPSASAETWEKVIRKVRGGMMPPVGMPHPDKAAMDAFAGYL